MAYGAPILLSYLPPKEKKRERDGGGLVEKEVRENIVSLNITQMLSKHVTWKI